MTEDSVNEGAWPLFAGCIHLETVPQCATNGTAHNHADIDLTCLLCADEQTQAHY